MSDLVLPAGRATLYVVDAVFGLGEPEGTETDDDSVELANDYSSTVAVIDGGYPFKEEM